MDISTLLIAVGLAIVLVAMLAFGLALGAGLVWWLVRHWPGPPIGTSPPRAASARAAPEAPVAPASPEAPSKSEARRRERRRLRELERELASRKAREIALVQRAADISRRDRAELIALQAEIENEARSGVEKARLLRRALTDLWDQSARLRQAEHRAHRLEVAVGAALASMEHSKRAQLRASHRLARTRGRATENEAIPHPPRPVSAPRGHSPFSDAP